MLTGDEHEDVHERESERIDGLEADMISALRPHIRRSGKLFTFPIAATLFELTNSE